MVEQMHIVDDAIAEDVYRFRNEDASRRRLTSILETVVVFLSTTDEETNTRLVKMKKGV